MSKDDDVKFIFLGWNKSETSDRIWGIIRAGERHYSFWGKRGKKLQFKEEHYPKSSYGYPSYLPYNPFKGVKPINIGMKDIEYFIEEKTKRGYTDFTKNADLVYEDCFNYLSRELFTAKICEKIRKKNFS